MLPTLPTEQHSEDWSNTEADQHHGKKEPTPLTNEMSKGDISHSSNLPLPEKIDGGRRR